MSAHVRIEREWKFPAIDIDLVLIAGFLAITLASIYLPVISETPIRSLLSLAMALSVPGYALAAALFPGKGDLGGMERAGLSFGLSFAVASLIGLGLNYTSWGIHLNPLVACLTLFSLACLVTAYARRHQLRQEDRFSPGPGDLFRTALSVMFKGDHSRLDRALTAFLVICILASAATLAFVIMLPKTGEHFTQFYILGPDGKADQYPTTLRVGEPGPVIVGIANHEHRAMTYDLIVGLNDSSGGTTRIYAGQFTLADNQTVEKRIDLVPDRAGPDMQVKFMLYANGDLDTPYREVHLWISVI